MTKYYSCKISQIWYTVIMNPSYIVILLGNPGNEYIKTRHNAGRIVGEFLVPEKFTYQKHLRSYVATEMFGGQQFLFVTPDTYMNECGVIVPLLQKQYDLPIENYIVMYDDLDIMLGDYKLSFDRGSGGHNGYGAGSRGWPAKRRPWVGSAA